jgi:hypothetical protein
VVTTGKIYDLFTAGPDPYGLELISETIMAVLIKKAVTSKYLLHSLGFRAGSVLVLVQVKRLCISDHSCPFV